MYPYAGSTGSGRERELAPGRSRSQSFPPGMQEALGTIQREQALNYLRTLRFLAGGLNFQNFPIRNCKIKEKIMKKKFLLIFSQIRPATVFSR